MVSFKNSCILLVVIFFILDVHGGNILSVGKKVKHTVVMIRHGESECGKQNEFCGWYDSPLSDRGKKEAFEAARLLKKLNYKFDKAYTSLLTRTHETLMIITKYINQPNLPVKQSWKLNERHYGDLTGYKKGDIVKKYGEEQVKIWRRSYDILPPPMKKNHRLYKSIQNNPKFKLLNEKIPTTESLKETMNRVIPFWKNTIVPDIKRGNNIIIIAHGTVLRSLIKFLENVSNNDIGNINVPSGIPFVYEFDNNMKTLSPRKYLGSEKRLAEGIAKAADVNPK